MLAMERGEVTGRCGWSWSSVVATRGNWIDENFVNILVQLSTAKHPDLPDVPLVMDLAESEEDRRLLRLVFARQVTGRPIFAPPNIPEERVEALRRAFDATMADPEFLADAERLELEITPVSGEDVQQLVADSYDTTPDVVERISEILGSS